MRNTKCVADKNNHSTEQSRMVIFYFILYAKKEHDVITLKVTSCAHYILNIVQGINLSDEELIELDNIVSPLIKNGQTIAHIYKTQNLNLLYTTTLTKIN